MDCRRPILKATNRGSGLKTVRTVLRPPNVVNPSVHLAPVGVKEQKGGNLRSILWQADLAAPGATQRAAREAPELIAEAAAGVDRPAETLVLSDKLLRMRG